jgi:hypothetical protein
LDPNDLDKIRRYLEDTVTLGSLDEDGDSTVIDTTSVQVDDIEEEDEDPGFQ